MKQWNEKPYHSLDYELRERFGEKVYRIALNGGMTCPNRDGTLGLGGCIFCSRGGSGDFAGQAADSISRQILLGKEQILSKRPVRKYIAYFQAFTNTYAPVSYLRSIYTEAIRDEDVVLLSIATRPDCLSDEIVDLLAELNRIKPVWIELGLQTIHEDTARFIRRGYPLTVFEDAVRRLRQNGIEVITHVILGLPGEDSKRMLETVRYLNTQDIQGVKLQLLHILKNTDLADYYETHPFDVFTMESYCDLIAACIGNLRPDIVIHRLTGDGPKDLLIAPRWSTAKRTVLNLIHRTLKEQQIWQGKYYQE